MCCFAASFSSHASTSPSLFHPHAGVLFASVCFLEHTSNCFICCFCLRRSESVAVACTPSPRVILCPKYRKDFYLLFFFLLILPDRLFRWIVSRGGKCFSSFSSFLSQIDPPLFSSPASSSHSSRSVSLILFAFLMAGEASWWAESSPLTYFRHEAAGHNRIREDAGDQDEEEDTLISLDAILPDDLLEKVLSFLPIASIIRSSSVCKRWYDAVHSARCSWTKMSPQKPWYFMFSCSDDAVAGFAYDPSLRKWYGFDFPCIENSNWLSSASCGLVCLMDGEDRSRVFVCNPITRDWRRLRDAPGGQSPDYSALAMAVDRQTHGYMVAVARCKQVPQDFYQWDFSIHLYESTALAWVTPFTQTLIGWRGGDECVICNGVLYYLIYSTGVNRNVEPNHCLVMYDLAVRPSSRTPLMQMAIPAPCSLTCGRLMNLGERLVMVGGIGKHDRPGIIKGIGIWELEKREWREVARMPHKFFQGFGEFDDVFASSGADDLVYIQSFGSPALLTFDMGLKLWKWSAKSPVTKRFPLQLFTGFCFEPRLEIAS